MFNPPTALFSTSLPVMAQEFKLKGLSGLDLQNGEKREVEVEGIEDGKILLVKQGDKTHALTSKCTHYGAPLKLGVLTPDGRLTCAWHGGNIHWPCGTYAVLIHQTSLFQCRFRRCRGRPGSGSSGEVRHSREGWSCLHQRRGEYDKIKQEATQRQMLRPGTRESPDYWRVS